MKHAAVIPMHRPSPEAELRRPRALPNDPSELEQLWTSLWRSKLTILLCLIVSTTLGAGYSLHVATPLYTATASLALESREQQVMDFDSVVSG
jgi:uncharacterized protein involved in exopolysaccharide biosynthesis